MINKKRRIEVIEYQNVEIPAGIDTSTENAPTENEIVSGKEAWANGEKIVGKLVPESFIDLTKISDIDLVEVGMNFMLGEYEIQQLYNGNYKIKEN